MSRSKKKTMILRSTLTLVAIVKHKDLPGHSRKKANAKIKSARDSKRSKSAILVINKHVGKRRSKRLKTMHIEP